MLAASSSARADARPRGPVGGIAEQPDVLRALARWHAAAFIADKGGIGLIALASLFLVVTGGEALYADMGHFGRRPIRLIWFALVLQDPDAASSPFYLFAPAWALYPLIGLATAETAIASQALISGAFSFTHQAIQLGDCQRLAISHTSAHESGLICSGPVNWALMVAACALVIGFGSSANLAAAYGMAVTATMLSTIVLLCVVARRRWGWGGAAIALGVFMLPIDLASSSYFLGRERLIPSGHSRMAR
jgi:KUP system potassium uptake protein